jgi:hypothetical protein
MVFTLASLALYTTAFYKSDLLQKFHLADSGLSTCFHRVNQTFIAKMIGDDASSHLTRSFTKLTSDCVGDLNGEAAGVFGEDVLKSFNKIATQVHWFHEKIDGKFGSLSSDSESLNQGINLGYQKIEALSNTISESIYNYNKQTMKEIDRYKKGADSLVFLTIVLLLIFAVKERKLQIGLGRVEHEARDENQLSEMTSSSKLEYVVKKALEINDLVECSKLFTRYHSDVLDGKLNAYIMADEENDFELSEKKSVDEVMDEVQTSAELEEIPEEIAPEEIAIDNSKILEENPDLEGLEKFQLVQIVSSVVDGLSEKLFSEGIFLVLELSDDLFIWGKKESLEVGIHHLLLETTKLFSSTLGVKRITMRTKGLGNNAVLEIGAIGTSWSEDLVAGKSTVSGFLDLVIGREVLADSKADLAIKNVTVDEKQLALIKIVLNRVDTRSEVDTVVDLTSDSGEVRSLKKGKKKDLVNELRLV